MDGYHRNAKGGEFVTYERLRAMGTNGFQEPATGFHGRQDRRHQATLRRRQVRHRGRQGRFMAAAWRGLEAPGKEAREGQVPVPDQQRPHQPCLAVGLSRPGGRLVIDRWPYPVHPDEPGRHGRARPEGRRSRRGLQRRRLDPGHGPAEPTAKPKADLHAVRLPDRRAGQRRQRRRQRARHPQLQADLGQHPEARRRPGGRRAPVLQVREYRVAPDRAGTWNAAAGGPAAACHKLSQRVL